MSASASSSSFAGGDVDHEDGLSASNAVDGNPATSYSSVAHSTASATALGRLRLIPRLGYGFRVVELDHLDVRAEVVTTWAPRW